MYLASSVVRALKENKDLSIVGLDKVVCPAVSCVTEPGTCSQGQQETCVKKVEIIYEHDGLNKIVVLVFRYQLKGHQREGYISEDDLALKILFDRRIIDKEALIAT